MIRRNFSYYARVCRRIFENVRNISFNMFRHKQRITFPCVFQSGNAGAVVSFLFPATHVSAIPADLNCLPSLPSAQPIHRLAHRPTADLLTTDLRTYLYFDNGNDVERDEASTSTRPRVRAVRCRHAGTTACVPGPPRSAGRIRRGCAAATIPVWSRGNYVSRGDAAPGLGAVDASQLRPVRRAAGNRRSAILRHRQLPHHCRRLRPRAGL
ncbi:unnamed protein product [Ixodes pacificus]